MALRLAELREASLAYFPQIAFERDGVVHRVDARDSSSVAFESCAPVRTFPGWRGKRNYSGLYWSSTMGGHVGFESLAEKAALMLLDRDPEVVAISSQPMWITWPKGAECTAHAPDFFVRLRSGEGEVVDVRPEPLIDDEAMASFEATQRLCEEVGLGYRVVSDLPPMLTRNLLFLSRYQADAFAPADGFIERLYEAGLEARTLRELAAVLCEGDPPSGLSMAYQLIWQGSIEVNLGEPIRLGSHVQIVRR